KMVTQHFAANSWVVGIDMMNEPPAPPRSLSPTTGGELQAFFRRAVDAMSPINPHWLWIYENGTFANAMIGGAPLDASLKLDRPNAVLSWHYYPDLDLQGRKETVRQTVDRIFGVLQEQVGLAQGWNQPFYMGEFDAFREGMNTPENQDFHATSP